MERNCFLWEFQQNVRRPDFQKPDRCDNQNRKLLFHLQSTHERNPNGFNKMCVLFWTPEYPECISCTYVLKPHSNWLNYKKVKIISILYLILLISLTFEIFWNFSKHIFMVKVLLTIKYSFWVFSFKLPMRKLFNFRWCAILKAYHYRFLYWSNYNNPVCHALNPCFYPKRYVRSFTRWIVWF